MDAGSFWIPILIIGVIYVPYVARPVRGEVLRVREQEFVQAAVGMGAGNRRVIFSEVLPNVAPTLIVLFPLIIATTVLTEAALSYLSIGVQAPQASWGTIIDDGQALLYTRPLVAIAPGIMIVLTVLALNVLGDGLRDALDPRAKRRIKGMTAFIVRRSLGMLVVMFAISVLVFLIFFATPGVDPARRLAGRNPSPETIAQIKHAFALDRPLPVRYALMMKHMFISRDLSPTARRRR